MTTPVELVVEYLETFEKLKAGYLATGVADWSLVAPYLADDLEIVEADGLPYGGTYTGAGALRAVTEAIAPLVADTHVEVITPMQEMVEDSATPHPDGVLVLGLARFAGTAVRTGERFDLTVCDVYRVRDGRITRMLPLYSDTKRIADIT
ncbi:nuclear transport factor 2 family protein [Rhizohabitans arisaemae]|uniref:nuclear transport factor 2 family protein n=1 Tax=Rhizohabitans arisaemae TaxID=2720610 RepID=UPI0024B05168|nr:nuclear transport factor 2 family protein [Rhizohabitans arisaemae]